MVLGIILIVVGLVIAALAYAFPVEPRGRRLISLVGAIIAVVGVLYLILALTVWATPVVTR